MLNYPSENNVTIRMVFLFPGVLKINLQDSRLGTYSSTSSIHSHKAPYKMKRNKKVRPERGLWQREQGSEQCGSQKQDTDQWTPAALVRWEGPSLESPEETALTNKYLDCSLVTHYSHFCSPDKGFVLSHWVFSTLMQQKMHNRNLRGGATVKHTWKPSFRTEQWLEVGKAAEHNKKSLVCV